jgi:uncharacterized protein
MAHQCVHCKHIIESGSKEILEGCADCGSHFFFYIRDEQLDTLKDKPIIIPEKEKKQVEKDIREMAGITQEDIPVVLDIEAVRVTGEGKFEIDLINLFKKDQPIVYKLEEGKYIIDLASSLKKGTKDLKNIRALE